MTTTNLDSIAAVQKIAEQNGAKLETIPVKLSIDADLVKKMKSVVSLYGDEIDSGAKQSEVVNFFLNKGFEALVASGEFDKRLKAVLER